MFRRIVLLGLAGVLVAGFSAVASAATTEEVLGKLLKQYGETKAYEADTKTLMKSGEMRGSAMTGHMATQVVEKDGKPVGTLMNWKQKIKDPAGGESEMLMVHDGEFVWIETKDPESGMVMVMKTKPGAQKAEGDAKQFTDDYDLKLVGEEDFDGQKMWVLEGAPKVERVEMKRPTMRGGMGPRPTEQPGKLRISVGQKDSYMHRFTQFDKAGKETSEMQFTNIKVNGKLAPSLFKYTPPRGAQVMDMTKGMPDFGGMIPKMPQGQGDDE